MTPEVKIHVTHGAPRLEWCDQCLSTHGIVNIYDADQPNLPPLGVWADHVVGGQE